MKLTPETLFGKAPLDGQVPSQLKLSPNGRYGSFLRPADDDRERMELWLVDTATGEVRKPVVHLPDAEDETAEDRAERERRRQFARGITAYAWHPKQDAVLLPVGGAAYLLTVSDDSLRRLTPANKQQSGIRLSSKGDWLSYVRDGDLYRLDVTSGGSGEETRLTQDGGGTVSNGLADFIAQEEMHRFDGHWWSPDDGTIAYTRVDTAPIPETERFEVDADGIRVIKQRYPFAGGTNAEVKLGLLALTSGETEWLDWALAEDDYLARVQFGANGALYVQAQSRDQKRLTLRRWRDSEWQEVLTETSDTWVNLHDNLTVLEDGRVLWTSERSGNSKLYIHDSALDREGRLVGSHGRRINRVLGAYGSIVWHLDSSRPTTQDVWWDDLRSKEPEPAATRDPDLQEWRDAAVNPEHGNVILLCSDRDTPPTLYFGKYDEPIAQGAGHAYDALWDRRQLTLPTTRVLDIRSQTTIGTIDHAGTALIPPLPGHYYGRYSNDDRHDLHYRLTQPTPFDPNRRYPVIVHVYGGPGVQRVRHEYPPLTLQLFAQAGFGVFELDNRGSANRDRAFESAIHGRLGHVEVADQLAGVRFLTSLDWVDAKRIGIFGHSYGGYMVLMCLAASHVFRAGVSVAPVTDWTLYDTHYTERYLGTPEDNPQGYADSAVLPRVPNIDAPLLLMHGMADDNVLFTHSLKLIKALQDAGKPFELMTYPGAKHGLQERSVAIHRYRLILDFLRRKLM